MSIIPRPLPIEIVEGEHYVTADLLNLLPGSSSPSMEPQTEAVGRELVMCALPENLSLLVRILARSHRHPDRTNGVAVWSV